LFSNKCNNAKSHIIDAEKTLGKTPFTEHERLSNVLRKCVECTIDETILNNVVPTKYSNKNGRINWNNLSLLKNQKAEVDSLHKIHSRLSGGELHVGNESRTNPIEFEEYKDIVNDLKIINNNNKEKIDD
jgi:hypothetical protein